MLVLRNVYPEGGPQNWVLFGEGIWVALFGTAFAWWLFPNEVSLIAVFLASIITADSIERVLDWNRVAIFERGTVPLVANLTLASKLLMMFLGCVVGFSALGLALPLDLVERLFNHQLVASLDQSFPAMQFGTVGGVLLNNLYVLLFFFAIALPFQQGGVMLAIAWNASVWGSTFSVLARRWSLDGGPGVYEAYGRVMAACTVHMALEAAAYTMSGLAGVFLSKAFHKHAIDSDPMVSILISVGVMMLLAALLIAIGAVWEGLIAGQLVGLLS
jgi:hypothetical protein